MKVLLVHPGGELYGSDRQVAESAAAFVDAGWTVTAVLPGDGPLHAHLTGVTVRTARFPVLRKSELRPQRLLRLLLGTPLAVLRLARLVRSVGPDVVYVNTVTLPHWVAAARLARRPVLVHVHEAEELTAPALRRVLYAPLVAATTVVVNSATTARVVGASCPRVRPRLVRVANGVPDPGAQPASAARPGHVALVSRLSPRKGVDVALEAVAALRAAGRAVSLTVCGSAFAGYEWFADELRTRAAAPDLSGHVRFAGFVDPVADELATASVVLAPSFGESFGNAAVEGLLAERPVVASDVQGLAEIVEDGVTGLLVAPGDAAALASAVGRLLDDASLARRLAEQGRAVALQRYGLERYRREIVAAVAHTAGTPAGTPAGPTAPSPSTPPVAQGGARSGGTRAALLVAGVAACLAALTACSGSGSSHATTTTSSASPEPAISAPSAVPSRTPSPTASRLTTAVPAPGGGNIHQVVPSRVTTALPPVAAGAPVTVDGVTVRLTGHRTVTGKATRPGEISGPASRLTLTVTNTSTHAVSLDDVVVTDTDARGTPLVALDGPPAAPFGGTLAAGATATGTYVFTLAGGAHNPYTVRIAVSGRAPAAQFVGALA